MRTKPEWLEERETTPERGYLAKAFFKQSHCPLCKYTGAPKRIGWGFGSVVLLLFLLLCYVLPGIIYLFYRANKAAKLICSQCESEYIIRV